MEGGELIRACANFLIALCIAGAVYFSLARFNGLAQTATFSVLNIIFLVFASVALKASSLQQSRPANLAGLASFGFGAALVVFAITNSSDNASLWLPYGCLISYA